MLHILSFIIKSWFIRLIMLKTSYIFFLPYWNFRCRYMRHTDNFLMVAKLTSSFDFHHNFSSKHLNIYYFNNKSWFYRIILLINLFKSFLPYKNLPSAEGTFLPRKERSFRCIAIPFLHGVEWDRLIVHRTHILFTRIMKRTNEL